MGGDGRSRVRVRAFAKINLALRVLGVGADGYHRLETTFQTLALHDVLMFTTRRGPFAIACDDPRCPGDRTNLIWGAAERMWRAAGRRGSPRGVGVQVVKRIPIEAGLGGGSSDAAAALRALNLIWEVGARREALRAMARDLGADVPFFLDGGTALGVERGDVLSGLPDAPPAWVVLAQPDVGVRTAEAYAWFDLDAGGRAHLASRPSFDPSCERGNDLEKPVAARHPVIAHLVRQLRRSGASSAAMSGSGSAVFGLFRSRRAAERAARALAGAGRAIQITTTLARRPYRTLARPVRLGGPRGC